MVDFGRDTSCTDSMKTGRFSSGARLVAEAAYRRLITPRGTLYGGEEEADYGLDLSELIGSGDPVNTAASLPGRIRSELTKDDRIDTVDVDVVPDTNAAETTFNITIEAQTAAGPFELTLLATEVTVQLLGIRT